MAIQSRRGPFSKFVPSKLKSAEVAFVESSDPTSKDGYGIYIGTPSDKAVQIARQDSVADTAAEVFEQIADSISDAEAKRVTAEKGRVSAEAARVSAEKAREAAQAKNNADQVQNNAAAKGMTFHVCGTSEYELNSAKTHNVPSIAGKTGVMYLTPKVDVTEAENRYEQWMYVGDAWELMGEEKHIDPVTTGDVDSIVAGTSVAADRYLNATGLTYWWLKAKAKLGELFAPVSHKHAASDVTSGTLPIARGGTGASTAAGALTALGAASASDLAALEDSVSHAPRGVVKREVLSVPGFVGALIVEYCLVGGATTYDPEHALWVRLFGYPYAYNQSASDGPWGLAVKAPSGSTRWCTRIPFKATTGKEGDWSVDTYVMMLGADSGSYLTFGATTSKRLFSASDGYLYLDMYGDKPEATPIGMWFDCTFPVARP